MNTPHQPLQSLRDLPQRLLQPLLQRLSPKQRQYAMLGTLLAGGVGLLWLIFAFAGNTNTAKTGTAQASAGQPSAVTNIGVMSPGSQVNPVDQWVGTAGRKLAQYENEREEQGRRNKDAQAFEAKTMQRFAELEQRLTSAQQAATSPVPHTPVATTLNNLPPAASLPPAPPPSKASHTGMMPSGIPGDTFAPTALAPPQPAIMRITVADRSRTGATAGPTGATSTNPASSNASQTTARTVATFLPVSFTRGTLLGGLDAPTGGQAQSNPHPILIRLADNSVLPNRFRAEYRECFVIAAGYGDISSERAYLRTESLSCVRADGATLEVKIQGSIYGEDGKVGMRGRLVTKQGQILANALLAGVVSGIGQGLATSSTEYSTSALGTVASTSSSTEAYRAGLGSGVGKALDRLAQYYIKLAENTFPVIEVDAGREVDVVITKGARIDVPMSAGDQVPARLATSPDTRYMETSDDGNY